MRLEGAGIACIRNERRVLDHVSFSIDTGEALFLTGPNGSGKSTLLRVIAGLVHRDGGSICCDGVEVAGDWPSFRRRLVYLGHLDPLKPALTLRENVAFWVGLERDARAADDLDAALDVFNLQRQADVPAAFLSAGQRRRANLVRLAASRAPLWLLDEPAVSLDRPNVDALEGLIATHRAEGGLVIAATHGDLAIADASRLDLTPSPAVGP